MIYIISDTHFSHNNIIRYCDRPFTNIQDMNKHIVEKWNSVVKPNDIVLHLGDVGFGLKEQLTPLITSLNGNKILIKRKSRLQSRRKLLERARVQKGL